MGMGVKEVQATLWPMGWNSSKRMTALVFHSLPLGLSHVLSLCKGKTGFGPEGEEQSSVLSTGLGAWNAYSSDTQSVSCFGQVTLNLSVCEPLCKVCSVVGGQCDNGLANLCKGLITFSQCPWLQAYQGQRQNSVCSAMVLQGVGSM